MQTARRQSETAKHWKDSEHKTVQINVMRQQTADRKLATTTAPIA